MNISVLHLFDSNINVSLPEKFTYPFNYKPHSLCILANEKLQDYLQSQPQWSDELRLGKMFGLLVVQTKLGELGFLAAFSGNLAGRNDHSYFVPPVFDMLQKEGFFKLEEQEISALNDRIDELLISSEFVSMSKSLEQTNAFAQQELSDRKKQIKANKLARDERRQHLGASMSDVTLNEMIKESQFEKADLKRLERYWKQQIDERKERFDQFNRQIEELKSERKARSAALQQKLFDQFKMLNIRGEEKGLCDIFKNTVQKTPPAGAGECAAPKLLQFAFGNNLKPIAMAEIWYGASPKMEIRHHGEYYPACKGKCEPILAHMLDGMVVENDPLNVDLKLTEIEILFEDDSVLIVNKPAGLLSVPGKSSSDSLFQRLRSSRSDLETLFAVHRLDMSTSGILLFAKDIEAYKKLQAQFLNRTVKKRYCAILDGVVKADSGTINLPLTADFMNRPCQKVDELCGKLAITFWEVLKRKEGKTLVLFTPVTGRTHQLRVHAAHSRGLNAPIEGDELYGRKSDRLYLHAEYLAFCHPVSGQVIEVENLATYRDF